MKSCSLLFLFFVFLTACGRPPIVEKEAYIFGTRIEVLVADTDQNEGERAIQAVLKEFQRIHNNYHAWQPSQLTDLNNNIQKNEPFLLNEELKSFVLNAQNLSEKSNYLFDPGIGYLIELWGFHSDDFKAILPPKEKIDLFLKEKPSIQNLTIKENVLISQNKNVALDFGGYLKGWALDRAAVILKEHNIKNALINIGGNILALGNKYGRPWRIGIQHPRAPGPIAILDLHDGEAIGTSGDYQRYFEISNKRYHHLLDPRTGFPSDSTQAVTILIPKDKNAGLYSDVYSKPIFIAGDEWQKIAKDLKLNNVLRINKNGKIEISRTFYPRLEFLIEQKDIQIVDF